MDLGDQFSRRDFFWNFAATLNATEFDMRPQIIHLPDKQFVPISHIISYWRHDGEAAWFARAWSILRKYGLTYFIDDFSKCICLVRGLALARSLRQFHMYYDEGSDPREHDYTLQDFGISKIQEDAFISFHGKEELEEIIIEQHGLVVSSIRDYFKHDETEIFLFYGRSIVPRREQSHYYDVGLSISNLQAYGWVREGCPFL